MGVRGMDNGRHEFGRGDKGIGAGLLEKKLGFGVCSLCVRAFSRPKRESHACVGCVKSGHPTFRGSTIQHPLLCGRRHIGREQRGGA